ncbi:D-xylose ABC transporter ATP-binding protein [Endozoicomonas sp. OPT23]|uniref:sugar ABC transporter ATP-binding protein n=1 Tax=Endozoicomonas sp. OPT23 TaxID=2072845 RepID=UPI00129A6E2D|nr:sugar ABC transporter ATP-binding protein [Endozoicomonas sp. OPT23]MRI35145.1 D-xylose ABC transporter ATP-binding protein [Endozoicomonas sp. OPT23]
MSNEVIMEIVDVHKCFGPTKALAGVNFTLHQGEIHALCGENGAGKSTLMKVIDGLHQPDSGNIHIKGKKVVINGALEAQKLGIGFVHQEIVLCPDVSVAENINMALTNQSKKWFVNYSEMNKRAKESLKDIAPHINPSARLDSLSISEQQLVEIAKALSLDCDVLILDEPTAALTEAESQALFNIMQALKAKGISIIYISHRMAEVFEQCDRVTVLRDGIWVCTDRIKDTSPDNVVKSMVGRDVGHLYPEKLQEDFANLDVMLEVANLSDGDRFNDIQFKLHQGEIFGVSGLIGAGRSEMVKAICGLHAKTSGEISFKGQPASIKHYSDSINQGIVYLSEDRKEDGVFLDVSIARNISVLKLEQVCNNMKCIDPAAERKQAQKLTDQLKLKSAGMDKPVSSLSGGNQQKVALAKMLSVNPSIIIMDEPTRGIDVGAKVEIHQLIRKLANEGVGVIVISSELPEVVGLCDRVMVMHEGEQQGTLTGDEITEQNIIHLASGLGQKTESVSGTSKKTIIKTKGLEVA